VGVAVSLIPSPNEKDRPQGRAASENYVLGRAMWVVNEKLTVVSVRKLTLEVHELSGPGCSRFFCVQALGLIHLARG